MSCSCLLRCRSAWRRWCASSVLVGSHIGAGGDLAEAWPQREHTTWTRLLACVQDIKCRTAAFDLAKVMVAAGANAGGSPAQGKPNVGVTGCTPGPAASTYQDAGPRRRRVAGLLSVCVRALGRIKTMQLATMICFGSGAAMLQMKRASQDSCAPI